MVSGRLSDNAGRLKQTYEQGEGPGDNPLAEVWQKDGREIWN